MKNLDPAFLAALVGARDTGLAPVRLVWIDAHDRETGDVVGRGFWTWDEDIEAEVIGGTTGTPVTRTYTGGADLSVGDIVYVSDLTIQSVEISMSQIADAAQDLVRGLDVRLARVEIHDGLIDPATGGFVAPPEPVFLGLVDAAPITTPAAGGEGSISLSVISEPISMLSRINPRKASYHGQAQRNGDQWGKYASTVSTWEIKWAKRS